MELPHSSQRQKYIDEIKEIESELKDSTATQVSADTLAGLQKRIDSLAEKFQYKEEIGTARYKLYELQAFIHYFSHKDDMALDFIEHAIEMRGATYPKAEKLKESISKGATAAKKPNILFFHKSPVTVFWLSFLTLGLYNLYWFYKHWRTIRLSTGVRTWPILSSIFQIFTAYSLFKRIRDNAARHKHILKGVGWLAALYIVVMLVSNGIARSEIRDITEGTVTRAGDIAGLLVSIVSGVVLALILAVVQKAANAHNVAAMGKNHKFRKIYAGEIIFAIVGILLFVISMYQYGHDIIVDQYPRGTQADISAENKKLDALQAEYDACSSSLNRRLNTLDRTSSYQVDSYNSDWEDCESTRNTLNQSIDRYNWLNGYDTDYSSSTN